MLVQDYQISDLVGLTGIYNLGNDMVTTVDALRIREDKANLLGKLSQATARVSGGSHKNLRVFKRTLGIFIIDTRLRT